MRGAEEHRLVLERHAAFAILQHPLHDVARLVGLVGGDHQRRSVAARALRPQLLGVAFFRQGDHRIGGGEDRLRRAIVARERHHRGRRAEGFGEVEDVAHRRRAEGIDRLGVVADHHHAAPVRPKRHEDRGLQPVGVLVFVDQDVVEAPADILGDGPLLQHRRQIEQEVVVIENVLALLGFRIGTEEPGEFLPPAAAPREGLLQHVGELRLLVDRARIDRQARRLGGEALLGVRQAQLVADEIHQVGRILAVVDGEGRVEADRVCIFAQKPRADAVEGAGPGERRRHAGRGQGARHDPLYPSGHLVGRPAREGHQQDAAGVGATHHQMRHPVRQRVGLARAGAGDDQQRPRRLFARAMLGGAALVGIERVERGHRACESTGCGGVPANPIHALFAITHRRRCRAAGPSLGAIAAWSTYKRLTFAANPRIIVSPSGVCSYA